MMTTTTSSTDPADIATTRDVEYSSLLQQESADGEEQQTPTLMATSPALKSLKCMAKFRAVLYFLAIFSIGYLASEFSLFDNGFSSYNPIAVPPVGSGDPEEGISVNTDRPFTRKHRIYSFIYASPVVLEDYKLIFFNIPKVACSTWKLLFHRMIGQEMQEGYRWEDLHDPKLNKLKHLFDYNITYVNQIMTDPTWTRAVFLRNPHERCLSAYKDKGFHNDAEYILNACCAKTRDCFPKENRTFEDFLNLIDTCRNGHWSPFTEYLGEDKKVWKYMNFIGHMDPGHMDPDRVQKDAKALLEKLGAWEEYGATGWGRNGTEAIFARDPQIGRGTPGRGHGTGSSELFSQYFGSQHIFDRVTAYYQDDYDEPSLGLQVPEFNPTRL